MLRCYARMRAAHNMLNIAVISDTHGLLRAEVLEQLQGRDHIIHAGDIGSYETFHQLQTLAPLTIVRGNVDAGAWANKIPVSEFFQLGNSLMYCLHNLQDLDLDPVAAELSLVISGHTHQPALFEKDGVRYLNPGSVGPKRFSLPISMATIQLQGTDLDIEFIEF